MTIRGRSWRGIVVCGLVGLGVILFGQSVFAQPTLPGANIFDPQQITSRSGLTLENVLLSGMNTLLYIAGVIAVIAIIWSGITYILSAGDPEKAEKGKKGLIYSTIGILLIALSIGIATYLAGPAAEAISRGESLKNAPASSTPSSPITTSPTSPVVPIPATPALPSFPSGPVVKVFNNLLGIERAYAQQPDPLTTPVKSTKGSTVLNALYADPSTTAGWPVYLWTQIRTFTNGLFVIAVIALALAQIFHFSLDTYAVKKTLPMALIAVVLANFSLIISRMIVEVAERLSDLPDLYGLAILNTISTLFGNTAGLSALMLPLGIPLACFAIALAAVLLLVLMLRPFIIWLVIAVSPLAFMCLALPTTTPIFKKWFGLLMGWSFSIVVVVYLMGFAGYASSNIPTGFNPLTALIVLVLKIGILALACTAPFKLGGALGSFLWSKAGAPAVAAITKYGSETQHLAVAGMRGRAGIWSEQLKDSKSPWGRIGHSVLGGYSRYGDVPWLMQGIKRGRETDLAKVQEEAIGTGHGIREGVVSAGRTAGRVAVGWEKPPEGGLRGIVREAVQRGETDRRVQQAQKQAERYGEMPTDEISAALARAIQNDRVEEALALLFAKAKNGGDLTGDVADLHTRSPETVRNNAGVIRQALMHSARASGYVPSDLIISDTGEFKSNAEQVRLGMETSRKVAAMKPEQIAVWVENMRGGSYDAAGQPRNFGEGGAHMAGILQGIRDNPQLERIIQDSGQGQTLDRLHQDFGISQFAVQSPDPLEIVKKAADETDDTERRMLDDTIEKVLHGVKIARDRADRELDQAARSYIRSNPADIKKLLEEYAARHPQDRRVQQQISLMLREIKNV